MKPAIRVENLSKQYRIGTKARPGSHNLTESIREGASALWRGLTNRARGGDGADSFWALKDVSFEVQPGEVVGIIGRNGAGKSTLLKILSRIAEPTSGRAVVRGRMASLLEVGTGFHPELTGRENVYLNGSILGMSRQEISRKFDEIAAFAEIDQFLDTPVKRYSSGMYVRLAFAVAAHLDPEILVVDEVLAVGDAGFQAKCLRRMRSIGEAGRTVLLVSHNLSSVRSLCGLAVTLEEGRVVGCGPADEQVARYLAKLANHSTQSLEHRCDREGSGRARLVHIAFEDGSGRPIEHVLAGTTLKVRLHCRTTEPLLKLEQCALSFWSADGVKVFHVDNEIRGQALNGTGVVRQYSCTFPRLPLPPGSYQLNAMLVTSGREVADHVYSAANLEVLAGDYYMTGRPTQSVGGLVYVNHEWQ